MAPNVDRVSRHGDARSTFTAGSDGGPALLHGLAQPFGGHKESGRGGEALNNDLETKCVVTQL